MSQTPANAAGFDFEKTDPAGVGWTREMVRRFFDQAPFYVGIISTTGHLTHAGRMSLDACGYRPEEVLGRLFWETAWWRGLPEAQSRIENAFAAATKGERFQANLPYRMADGIEHRVDFAMSPAFDQTGAVAFVIVIGTDISDRIRAESELVVVRNRLDAALMANEIGTYQWDVRADRLYVDANSARLFGIALDHEGAAPLSSFLAAIHPEDRPRVIQRVQHSVDTADNFEEDYRILSAGDERWVNSRGRMTRDSSGNVVTFFGVLMDITARKRAEQERESIAERLRRLTVIHETVLSGINDFAYVFDLQGRFVYANRPLLELYGRDLDGVAGKTFSELGYPAWHAEMHLREIAQVISTRRPLQGEIPFRGESGISGVYDYIFTPVVGVDGTVEAVAGTTRDVTERKRGEVRDRLLVALDDATRPLTDPDEITQASARLLCEHLGVNRCAYADVDADENTFNLTGDFNRDVSSIVGRYRFDQFGDECLRSMRGGEPYVVVDSETNPQDGPGREIYRATQIRSAIWVPLTKSGRFVAAMSVHQTTPRSWLQSDIEALQLVASRCWESIERARVIRVLAESERRLRLALTTGRLGVWEFELPAQALSASPECRSIYGRSADEPFTFKQMWDTAFQDERDKVMATLWRHLEEAGEFDLEYRIKWPDGSLHWILVRAQTSCGPDGKPQRMIGVSLDITARKEAEREQVRLREEADRASRAKDEFLATLSHELRTPLNPVLLIASDAAMDPNMPDAAREAFGLIRKNVELEARLIDDLLDLTTIVRGKITIKKDVRDLRVILSDAIAAVQPEFDAKAVKLSARYGPNEPWIFADEVRIAQVFINLLKNAAKFTPHGGWAVLATAVEGDMILVQLIDTGIGMSPEELGRIFGAFEQGDHASEHGSHRFGGLGLGLAIAQRLVELHGGTISAVSEGVDRGTTFSVKLPRYVLPVSDVREEKNSTMVAMQVGPHPGARLLLVEDDEATRKALVGLLRRRNYVVVTAGSVSEARACAEAENFDAVLSDLGLPDGDGTTLMAELRDRFGLSGIALTGFGMEEDIARCRAAGFVSHLTKPIRVEALESVLRGILHRSASDQQKM